MKKIRLYRMLAIIVMTALAILVPTDISATLQIYKVKGNVTVKNKAKTIKATRRANVRASDLLYIPAGGRIDILDSESHRIYSSISTGKMTVKSLIEKAESNAANITRNINKKVMAAMADNAGEKRKGYDVIGMAIHETDAIAHPPVVLPEGVSYLSYLLDSAKDPDSTHQSYISLKTLSVAGEDVDFETPFNFVLHNSMRQPLYFNIIGKDDKDNFSLLFPQNPIAAPKTETIAEEYCYLPGDESQAYVAIASDVDFSVEDVKRLLEAGYNPDDDYYLTILTMKQTDNSTTDK